MSGIRTPLNATPAFALGQGKWLKEVLRAGDLHYQGGTYPITTDYLDSVVDAYNAKAIKRVPFQLADADNRHTQAPERRKGFIEGLRRNGDSLEAVIELDGDANAIVESDASFPVSVLINHNRTTGEGREFPAVLSHVLGTYDPVLTDLSDWVRLPEEIAASNDGGGDVIDFLALNAAEHAEPLEPATTTSDSEPAVGDSAPSSDEGANPDPSEGTDDAMPDIDQLIADPAKLAELRKALAALEDETPQDAPGDATSEDGTDTVPDGDDDTDDDSTPSDEEIAAMLATTDDLEQDTPAEEPEQVAASQSDHNDQLALANARLDEQNLALSRMRGELDERNWEQERDSLIRSNLTPAIVELAKPFLHGSHNGLALSNDAHPKAAAQVRKILTEVSKSFKTLGLGQGPIGTSEEVDAEKEQAAARKARADEITKSMRF